VGSVSFFARRNVLVTGGASFIGSHLAIALLEAGARVTVADNY
jgi:nucleoside-diphosphate-sugar epimerase